MYESTKYEMVLKLCTLSMQAIKAGRANAVSFIHLKFTRKKAHWIDKVSPQSFNHQSLYTVSCIVPFAWYDPFFLLKHFDCTLTKMNFNLFFSPEFHFNGLSCVFPIGLLLLFSIHHSQTFTEKNADAKIIIYWANGTRLKLQSKGKRVSNPLLAVPCFLCRHKCLRDGARLVRKLNQPRNSFIFSLSIRFSFDFHSSLPQIFYPLCDDAAQSTIE